MKTITEQLQALYQGYFARPADVGGLIYWSDAMNAGATIAQVSAQFALQPEYKAFNGNKHADEVVDQVYLNLFGRHAEAGGKAYWGGILTAHPDMISNIVSAIADGARKADGNLNADGAVYQHKLLAADLFTAELQVIGHESERLAYAGGAPAVLNIARNFIAAVSDDISLEFARTHVHETAEQLTLTLGGPVHLAPSGGASDMAAVQIVGSHQLLAV